MKDLSCLKDYCTSYALLNIPEQKEGCVIYLLNSPSIREAKQDADACFIGNFFLTGYQIRKEEQILFGGRLEILFNENCQIRSADYQELLSLVPEKRFAYYPEMDELSRAFRQISEEMSASSSDGLSDTDLIAVQQLTSAYVHKDLKEDASDYCMLFSPFLAGTGQEASLLSCALHFQKKTEPDEYDLTLSLKRFCFTKNMQWELTDIKEPAGICLSPLMANPKTPPQAATMIARKLAEPLPEVSSPEILIEDYADILNQAAQWVRSIQSCDPECFIQNILDEETDAMMVDIILPVKGRAGFEEQFGMMKRMKELQPKHQGVHILTTPMVVKEDDTHAAAYFLDYGWTILGKAFGVEANPAPVLPDEGRYIMKFRKVNGIWKMYSLNWGPVIQYGAWAFDANF